MKLGIPGRRRGGSLVVAVAGLVASLITVSVGMDTGRLIVTRHKDQSISDAATMAAMVQLPYQDRATAAANKVLNAYRASYGNAFTATIAFSGADAAVPTSVQVDVSESPPMFLGGVMGAKTRSTQAVAAGSRMIPAALLTGAVPLGIQYDDLTFDLPTNNTASASQVTLKLGKGDKKEVSGNCYALDLPGGSGASDWSSWLKYGYTSRLAVGDAIDSKPGTMTGPTDAALVSDVDSRLNRAEDGSYADDTYTSFSPGNPRIICVPLVDWTSAHEGKSTLEIKGFGAFWIDDFTKGSGNLTGRFVRYTIPKGSAAGTTWDGVSIDPTSSGSYDGGLWTAQITK